VVIDMHMHVDEIPALGWHMSASQCVASMDEAGIDAAAIMTITDLPEVNPGALEMIADACIEYPGRLFAFARVHPWYQDEAVRLLKLAISKYDFRGLKLHPVTNISHPSGEDTLRLIRTAAELGVPTLFHCGDEPMTTPLSIAPAAEACPEATIILGHMGGYFHVDEAIEVADRHPNVVLETSAMPYPNKITEAVQRIGAERVIFGSDGPVCSPALERQKVVMAQLSPAQEARVLGLNAMTLLGIKS